MKITVEEIERILKNYLLQDYEYFTDRKDLVNKTSSIDKDENHDPTLYHFDKVFPNANFSNNNTEKFNMMQLDISDDVYLMVYYYGGGDRQFTLSVYYHGVSVNLYTYFNKSRISGFREMELFSKINLDDFDRIYGRHAHGHHEYHMICAWKNMPEFFGLGVVDDTIYINQTWMYSILGDDRRGVGRFDGQALEKLKIKHIVFQAYTYSLTEQFDLPSTLETVSFDFTKDKYHSVRSQRNRVMSQDKAIIPFIQDKKLKKEADKVAEYDKNLEDYNKQVILNFNNNKGVVLTNMYAYNNFKKSCKDKELLKKVVVKKIGSGAFEKMIVNLPQKIGETSWFKSEFEVLKEL